MSYFDEGNKPIYTDEEFWDMNPICENVEDDIYSINGYEYWQDRQGNWNRVGSIKE